MSRFLDPALPTGSSESVLHIDDRNVAAVVVITEASRKQPLSRTMGSPEIPEHLQGLLGQGNLPFFAALTQDPQHHPGTIHRTNGQGRFSAGPLRGGTYHLQVGSRGSVVRVWKAGTAPPSGQDMALIVAGGDVVRGQMPLKDFLSSDMVVGAVLIGAIVALPIIVHNSGSGSKSPASP